MVKNSTVFVFVFPLLLGGCADYMNHRDSVTLGVGNAVEANAGIHEIAPWPPDVSKTTIHVHGNQLPAGAVKKKKTAK